MSRRRVYSVMALTPAFTSTAAAATMVASTTTRSGPQIFEPASFLAATRRTASSPLLPTVIDEYTHYPSYTPYTNSDDDDDADTEADHNASGHVLLARWKSKLGMRSRTAALKAINTGHGTETEDEPVSSILLLFCAHTNHVFRFPTCQPPDSQNQQYQSKIPCTYRNSLPSSFTPCACWRPSRLFSAPSSTCITLSTLRPAQNLTVAPVPTISLPQPGCVSVLRDPDSDSKKFGRAS